MDDLVAARPAFVRPLTLSQFEAAVAHMDGALGA